MDGAKINFRITAYSPSTMPMSRLAEYMAQYAAILGNEAHVHFERLVSGSTILRARVEDEDVPKVDRRLALVGGADAPQDIGRAYDIINGLLRADNARATLRLEGSHNVVKFPGFKLKTPPRIGPIKDAGILEGEIVRVGGRDRTIHVHLVDAAGETYKLTTTSRDIAKEMARHLFSAVRVTGTGLWIREESGRWCLDSFAIQDFEPVEARSLIEALAELRNIEGSDWGHSTDPLEDWRALRRN